MNATAVDSQDDVLVGSSISSNILKSTKSMQAYTTIRYHYLDNLRALAMMVGVLFHAALSHSVLVHNVWPTADTQSHICVDIIAWLLHTFRMPLFFLISGFFAHYLVQKYGLSGFIKNRAKRILLPFVIFWPIITAGLVGLFFYIIYNMPVETSLLSMIKLAVENPEAMNGQSMPVSTTHLWFLYYLSIFCILTGITYKFLPIDPKVLDGIFSPWALFVVFPLVSFAALLNQMMPHPAPESFVPTLWAGVFFGIFFLVGWVFFVRQEVLVVLDKYLPYLIFSSVIFSLLFIYNIGPAYTLAQILLIMKEGHALSMNHVLSVLACAILAWHLTLVCLLLGRRYLNWQNSVLRYVTDASYWVYIIHMPIIFYAQAYFHKKEYPIVIEILGISLAAFGVGFLSYALLVRRTPIGWLLHGKKRVTKS